MNKCDAILACRVQGDRLYAKPLQRLVPGGITIIESLLSYLFEIKQIRKIILAIAEGEENYPFIRLAKQYKLPYVVGDQKDVLGRFIKAIQQENVEHVFRVTTENPFICYNYAGPLIEEYFEGNYDIAMYKDVPEGTGFELIKTIALLESHKKGKSRHKSELVTSYIFDNQEKFNVLFKKLPEKLQRPNVRFTVDHAEDLVFCQNIYRSLKKERELIDIQSIINFWDNNPEVRKEVEKIGVDWGHGRLWK